MSVSDLIRMAFWYFKRGIMVVPILGLLQTPLLLTVAVFGTIFWKYNNQELGNNPYRYLEAYDSTKIHVTGKETFSREKPNLQVYKASMLTLEDAKEKGERIFKALGTTTDASRTDVYDETVVLYPKGIAGQE